MKLVRLFGPQFLEVFNATIAGLADLWPSMAPSQDRTPPSPPQPGQRWAAPGGGKRPLSLMHGGPAAGGAAQAGNGRPRRDSRDRYVFYLIYPPPPGIELTLPGGGSGALPLGQRGGGLVVGDILYAPFKHDDIGTFSQHTKIEYLQKMDIRHSK